MSSELTKSMMGAAWRRALLCGAVALGVMFTVYFETFASMAYTWWHFDTYTHGLLILPISAYLVWDRRSLILQQTPTPFPAGLGLVIVSSGFWLVSSISGVQLFMQVAFFALLISLMLTILGVGFLRLSLFPLGYLFFAVPFGEELIPLMMDITANFSVAALRLTDIPFYYEGRFIHLPTGNWEVAEACSGVRYIIASVALGLLYAYWSYQKWWKRVVFVVFSLLVPVLANGLRAFGIILLGHYSGMTLAVGVDHLIYGWLFFGLVMFVLFWLGSFWRDDPPEHLSARSISVTESPPSSSRQYGVLLLACLMAVTGFTAQVFLEQRLEQAQYQSNFPPAAANWSGPRQSTGDWRPKFPGAQLVQRQSYDHLSGTVTVYLVHYGVQQQGKELINATNYLLQPETWRVVTGDTSTLGLKHQKSWKKTVHTAGDRYRLLASTYSINGELLSQDLRGKLREIGAYLSGSTAGSSLIGVSVDYEEDHKAADQLLLRFLQDHPEMRRASALVQPRDQH